jgi:hypothetical protein
MADPAGGTIPRNVLGLACDRGLASFDARVDAAKWVDPGRFVCVAGRAEAVGEHRAYAGRGRADAGAVRQAVAVMREAERAFPRHDRSGGVAGITASLRLRPSARCGPHQLEHQSRRERALHGFRPLQSGTMRPFAKK